MHLSWNDLGLVASHVPVAPFGRDRKLNGMVLPRAFGGTMTTISATKPRWSGGRPKLAKEDVRKPYGVRLSELELQEARERAVEAGIDLSTYCRNAILNAAAPRPAPPTINLEAWLELAKLADTIIRLARDKEIEQISKQLTDVSILLASMRLSLLGIHETLDDEP